MAQSLLYRFHLFNQSTQSSLEDPVCQQRETHIAKVKLGMSSGSHLVLGLDIRRIQNYLEQWQL